MDFLRSLRGLGLILLALVISWFACRKKFDLSEKNGNFGEERLSGVRFDVSLDPSFLTAYNARFRCLACGNTLCNGSQSNCNGQTGTGVADIGSLRVDRVLSGKQVLILLKESGGESKLVTMPIIDSSRPQLLLRSKVLSFTLEQSEKEYVIEKAVVIDAEDSTILASPLRTPEACASKDKCRFRDSLVDSAYRLPIKFRSPAFDSGILVVPLRMSLAGKGLWSVLPPDSLGYTAGDFKDKTLSAPKSPCNGSCP